MLSSQLVVYMSEVLMLVGVMFVDGIYPCRPRTTYSLLHGHAEFMQGSVPRVEIGRGLHE